MRLPPAVVGTAWPGPWRILVWSAVVVLAPLSTWATVQQGWPSAPLTTLWVTLALHVAATAIVAMTLRADLGMILAAVAGGALLVPTPMDLGADARVLASVALMAGLYAVWRTPARRRWPWLAAVVALSIAPYVVQPQGLPTADEDVVATVAVLLVIVLFAERARRRRVEVLTLEQRARDLERLRHLESAAAVAEERARIAGELRDVLTRTTADVVTRAERARESVGVLPEVLGEIESAGRRALADIRALVATTRDGAAGAAADGGSAVTPQSQPPPPGSLRSSTVVGGSGPGDRSRWAWRLIVMATGAGVVLLMTGTVVPRTAIDDWGAAIRLAVLLQLAATVVVVTLLRAAAGAVAALALHVAEVLTGFAVAEAYGDWTASVAVLTAVLFGIYAVLRSPDRRRLPWWVAATAVVLVGVPAVSAALSGEPWLWVEIGVINWIVAVVGPALAAETTRPRRFELDRLFRRAEDLERMRQLEARAAVSEERARIARELHDILAHTTTAIVVQAGAARRVARRSPADALEALAAIESAGRAALGEIRHMISATTGADAPTVEAGAVPAGSGESLDQLPDLVAAAGLPVDLAVTGSAAAVPADVAHAAYRIVQEALTNVRKHAPDTPRVSVVVHRSADSVSVRVTDDGPGPAGSGPLTGVPGGYGLVGMAERARRCGGTVTAGPREDVPGWEVVADLPRRAPAAAGA